MATGLQDLLSAMLNGVQAINNLGTKLDTIFPQATAISTTAATAGAITYTSSQATAFMTVVTSSGGQYKVALYT